MERAERDEPVNPVYHLVERQIIPIAGTASYNPALLDWFRRDDYIPRPTHDLTDLYQAGSVFIPPIC